MCQGGNCLCCCCFSKDTLIYVKENYNIYKKPISEVKNNDLILSLKDGKKFFTKVKSVEKCKDEFEFYQFRLMKDGKIKSITVTNNHIMIAFNKEKNEIKFKAAENIDKNSDYFYTLDGLYQIIEINIFKMKCKYDLEVEEKSIIADDILVTCLNINKISKNLLNDMIEKFKMSISLMN